MKRIFTLILSFGFLSGVIAQNVDQFVISGGGNFAADAGSGISLSWTIGETVIATLDNEGSGPILTQGFQQPLSMFTGQIVVVPEGWSGLSSYIDYTTDVSVLMAPIIEDFIILKTLTVVYWPPINNIGPWDSYIGYKIKVENEVSLYFEGTEVTNKVVDLNEGWTIIPVLANHNVSTEDLFGALGTTLEIVKEIAGNGVYWPSQGINFLPFLSPGRAYMVYTYAEASIDYAGLKGLPIEGQFYPEYVNQTPWNDVLPTGTSHTIAVTADALAQVEGLDFGDVIGVFTQEGLCAGTLQLNGYTSSVSLTAFSDDETTKLTDGFDVNEAMTLKLYKPATNEEFVLVAKYDESMQHTNLFAPGGLSKITGLEKSTIGLGDFILRDVELYPNPASTFVTLNVIGQISDKAMLSIYGAEDGKVLREEPLASSQVRLNVSTLPQGVYFVRITDVDRVVVKKLIIQSNK
ncbi:MAG: T9SS type A sorting domain-containing protein [Bacteroidales bacterium]|nr:T9SS type A sorting domain-containing protein [Bacteroidales bacterium]